MTKFITALSYLQGLSFVVLSPDGVLDVVAVKGDEEAEDGEEHNGVGCENKTTRSPSDLQVGWSRREVYLGRY